ncbi:MAG: EamA family transporter RarD [Ruaniaceae bacterium]|nr:EamA family transporter RarD [Ruaniaceae bacterium]
MTERSGYPYGIAAYLCWGLFPLFFRALDSSGPFEIVAHRAAWSFAFSLALVLILRQWSKIRQVFRTPRIAWSLALAGFLVTVNWTLYVWAVNSGHTLDAAMGYFINPLVSALLAVLVLRESLTPTQWVAFGFGAAAVVVLIVGYGSVPYFAIGLAISFGLYGLVKKRVGGSVGALPGFAVETGAVLPIALGYLTYLAVTGGQTATSSPGQFALLVIAGPVTALPLLLFAAAASRLPLAAVGMLQYMTPIMQFLIGWLVFSEPLPPERLAGFVLVWLALVIFTFDALRSARRNQRLLRAARDV